MSPKTTTKPAPRTRLDRVVHVQQAEATAAEHAAPVAMASSDTLLTEKELSREIRIAVPTLQQWRHRGEGPAYLKLGRMVRYRRADVAAWLASTRVGGAA